MRALLCGTAAGFGLSWLRLPGPLDPLELPVAAASDALSFRALALLALAAGLARREAPGRAAGSAPTSFGPRSATRLALGASAGFALHAFLLGERLAPGSFGGALVAALVLLLAVRVTSGGESAEPAPRAPAAKVGSLGLLELAALCGLGAATAGALEALARWGRMLTPATRDDEAVLALAMLLLVALGAASFGKLLGPPSRRAALAPPLLAAAAAATLVGWRVVGNLASPRGLERYFRHPLLRQLGLDGSFHGTFGYDLAIGASLFVVPALVLGLALAALDTRARLASVLAGAAAGLVLFPRLLGDPAGGARTSPELAEPLFVAAAACAALALLARRLPGGAKLAGLALAALAAAPAVADWPEPHPPIEPWRQRPTIVESILELPEGVVAFESAGATPRTASLGGRPIAPEAIDRAVDLRALRFALAHAPSVERGPRVLLVGQLTPQRAALLAGLGASSIDRTASFWRAFERIETVLFDGLPPPAGERLSPQAARERWRAGEYELVVAPAAAGVEGPALRAFARAAREAPGTSAFLWLDPRTPLADDALGERLCFVQEMVEDWRVAVAAAARGLELGFSLPAGEPGGGTGALTRLRLRGEERADRARTDLAERLARASRGEASEHFCAGLAAFAGAQRPSSPFESRVERIEIPSEALAHWRRAAEAEPLPQAVRELWEALASALADKRWVDELLALEPLVERHRPWPAVERALAYGELEALEPEAARERLERVVRDAPTDGASWAWLGEARRILGRHSEAAEAFRRASDLLPGRHNLERALTLELVKSGDPEGRPRLLALLEEHPEDLALSALLEAGPREAPEPGLRPHLLSTSHAPH